MTDGSRIRVFGHVFVWVRLVDAGKGGEKSGLPIISILGRCNPFHFSTVEFLPRFQ